MSMITEHVGQRIRKSRKGKGLTLDDFARKIGKSKATVSKYENGTIALDIETLLAIADALEMDVKSLIDYKSPNIRQKALPKDTFFDQSNYYMYYYDGRIKKVVRSLLELTLSDDESAGQKIEATLYMGLDNFNNTDKSQHIFEGRLLPYDTITHISLTNQINKTERLYLCVLNPMHAHAPAVGIMSGIASNPFFAPMGMKIIISKNQLAEDAAFRNTVELSKSEYKNFKAYNMMVINRPTSLFLTEK